MDGTESEHIRQRELNFCQWFLLCFYISWRRRRRDPKCKKFFDLYWRTADATGQNGNICVWCGPAKITISLLRCWCRTIHETRCFFFLFDCAACVSCVSSLVVGCCFFFFGRFRLVRHVCTCIPFCPGCMCPAFQRWFHVLIHNNFSDDLKEFSAHNELQHEKNGCKTIAECVFRVTRFKFKCKTLPLASAFDLYIHICVSDMYII